MDTLTIIGSSGAALILIAFCLNQMHKWSRESFSYDFINLIGSGLLMYYAYVLGSWPFFVLNGVWAAVSFKDVVKKR